MNSELSNLFEADQQDRADHPPYGTAAYWELRQRDQERRQRVQELIEAGQLHAPEDYYHAARIFQHGDTIEEIWRAYQLAKQSADLGHRPGRWLAAAAYDRWLMYQGRPQKYGTQFVPDGRRYRLWDIEPATTDEQRAEWDVPSLAEQLERAKALTRHEPMPTMEDAPDWLKAALKRWQTE
jgi:hypothetical protein